MTTETTETNKGLIQELVNGAKTYNDAVVGSGGKLVEVVSPNLANAMVNVDKTVKGTYFGLWNLYFKGWKIYLGAWKAGFDSVLKKA